MQAPKKHALLAYTVEVRNGANLNTAGAAARLSDEFVILQIQ